MLWVVRDEDVPYASESCQYGRGLESQVIKHSNLTGGRPAFSAGELILLDEKTVVITGCSGRYGPRSPGELEAVAKAFKLSGYISWCMGFDEEAGFPLPFVGSAPIMVD
jgi:hypothetical protein